MTSKKPKVVLDNKTPKFRCGYRVRITKYRNIFRKGNSEHWSRKIFSIYSVLNSNPWTDAMKDLNEEKYREPFMKKIVV